LTEFIGDHDRRLSAAWQPQAIARCRHGRASVWNHLDVSPQWRKAAAVLETPGQVGQTDCAVRYHIDLSPHWGSIAYCDAGAGLSPQVHAAAHNRHSVAQHKCQKGTSGQPASLGRNGWEAVIHRSHRTSGPRSGNIVNASRRAPGHCALDSQLSGYLDRTGSLFLSLPPAWSSGDAAHATVGRAPCDPSSLRQKLKGCFEPLQAVSPARERNQNVAKTAIAAEIG
jgi:hypothetical protein